MLPVILIIAAVFVLLFVLRVGGARRLILVERWPAVALAGAALFAFARGGVWPGIVLAGLSVLAWTLLPTFNTRLQKYDQRSADDPDDAKARAALGVGADASESDIRSAYRAKMARAHPDQGGTNAEAARLTAARDRLLRSKKR